MKVVIQRVLSASVLVADEKVAEINQGILVFVGIEDADNDFDIDWLAQKIVNLRIFNDDAGVMNLSVKDIDAEIIIETVVGRKLETTYHEVLNSIHPHPTISESVKDAIEVAYGEAIHL